MALNAAVVWEVQTGGADTNGGGYKTGASGTDRSQQTSPHATLTANSIVHTTTTQINVHAGDYTVSATDVGNVVQVTGGTATAGFYEITVADTGNNRWTMDRAVGTDAQTVVGYMGGCLATPGKSAGAATIDGMQIWVKAGTYTITTTTPGAAGPVVMTPDIKMEGYQTTRGDMGTKPVLSAGTQTTCDLFSISASRMQVIKNMKADCNSQAGVTGFYASVSTHRIVNCDAINAASGEFGFTGVNGVFVSCYAKDCATGFGNGIVNSFCEANDCTTGFSIPQNGNAIGCVAYGTQTTAFSAAASGTKCIQCTAVGATTGFTGGASRATFDECLASSCTTGFVTSGTRLAVTTNSFTYDCGTQTSGTFLYVDTTNLTADPFVDAAGEDYRPNTTSGGGASLRAAVDGIPNQTNNLDAGGVQHSDPVGGGGILNHPGLSFGSM